MNISAAVFQNMRKMPLVVGLLPSHLLRGAAMNTRPIDGSYLRAIPIDFTRPRNGAVAAVGPVSNLALAFPQVR
jgi:hypothetical protein